MLDGKVMVVVVAVAVAVLSFQSTIPTQRRTMLNVPSDIHFITLIVPY